MKKMKKEENPGQNQNNTTTEEDGAQVEGGGVKAKIEEREVILENVRETIVPVLMVRRNIIIP